jgi:hypothetical protein
MWRETVNYCLSLHSESWVQLCLSTTIMIFSTLPDSFQTTSILSPTPGVDTMQLSHKLHVTSTFRNIQKCLPVYDDHTGWHFSKAGYLHVTLTWLLHTWQTQDSKHTHPALDELLCRRVPPWVSHTSPLPCGEDRLHHCPNLGRV